MDWMNAGAVVAARCGCPASPLAFFFDVEGASCIYLFHSSCWIGRHFADAALPLLLTSLVEAASFDSPSPTHDIFPNQAKRKMYEAVGGEINREKGERRFEE